MKLFTRFGDFRCVAGLFFREVVDDVFSMFFRSLRVLFLWKISDGEVFNCLNRQITFERKYSPAVEIPN